jgi:hypothetical protein
LLSHAIVAALDRISGFVLIGLGTRLALERRWGAGSAPRLLSVRRRPRRVLVCTYSRATRASQLASVQRFSSAFKGSYSAPWHTGDVPAEGARAPKAAIPFLWRFVMRGLRLHLSMFLVVAVAAVAAAQVANAGNPDVEHVTFGPFVNDDDDFCGTGTTVTETFSARQTVWHDPNQPVDTRLQFVADDIWTSAATGMTVIVHNVYSYTDVLVSGDPNGVNTHQWTFKGAAQITRVAGSGVLIRDAGKFVVLVTWSGPEFESDLIDVQVVRDAGGHPSFNSDFCAAMVPALGLG